MIKDLDMRGLSWIIWMGPKYNHTDPYKIEAEGYLTDRRVGGNVTTETATEECQGIPASQGMLRGTRSWRRWGTDPPLEPPEGESPCLHPDFGPVILISDSGPPEIWVKKFCFVLSHPVCGNLLQQRQDTNRDFKHLTTELMSEYCWYSFARLANS